MILLAAVGSACSVYEPELIEQQEAAATRVGGVRPQPMPDAGREPEPDAGGANTMTARPAVCGDGLVNGDELCDTAIAADQPGACPPQDCPPLSECGLRARRGEGCQAACVLLPEACVDGDRCCPSDCTGENDSDCSRSCGDGVVQGDQETCEDGTDTACPTQADCDDGMACTEDVLLGSADNCNAECAHNPITTLGAGDGCCPEGANANSDPDCPPQCGNGVRETGEQCDGVPGCNEQCVVTETPEQLDCIERLAEDECLRCACVSCTQRMLDCFDSGDATRDMHCSAINACGRDNDCVGTPCYCGDLDTAACGAFGPAGPCVDEIHAAASAPDPFAVTNDRMDPATAIGRAYALSECAVTNCIDVCP